jgi:hypothetical protein
MASVLWVGPVSRVTPNSQLAVVSGHEFRKEQEIAFIKARSEPHPHEFAREIADNPHPYHWHS